jgi:hypothetical protein
MNDDTVAASAQVLRAIHLREKYVWKRPKTVAASFDGRPTWSPPDVTVPAATTRYRFKNIVRSETLSDSFIFIHFVKFESF